MSLKPYNIGVSTGVSGRSKHLENGKMQPNFIIFLTDDQGYGDLSCMGATDFKTPHLDRMAAEGARFTDWYSNSPVCSPSRASLLTGRYPCHAGVRSILAGHRTATGLPPFCSYARDSPQNTRLLHRYVW